VPGPVDVTFAYHVVIAFLGIAIDGAVGVNLPSYVATSGPGPLNNSTSHPV